MSSELTIKNESLKWNVIGEEEFKERVNAVFSKVADTLKNTLGPYGSTTIIEQFGQMYITKDGWNILKNIHFDEPVERNIMQLLLGICAPVVIKVGDGSTSSIVAADAILKKFNENSTLFEGVRPYDLIDSFKKVVEKLSTEIISRSTKVNKETFEDIENVALVSTNGDVEISRFIKEIYQKTENPYIQFENSKVSSSSYEIVEGYEANISFLDPIYITEVDEAICSVKNPLFLMFDHQATMSFHLKNIIQKASAYALSKNRRLVVIAPYYDNFLTQYISNTETQLFRSEGTSPHVFCRVSMPNNILREYYNDFAILLGGRIIREVDLDDFVPKEEGALPVAKIEDYIGEASEIKIGNKKSIVKGLYNIDQNLYEISLRDAQSKFKELETIHRENSIVDSKLYEVKKRIAKLKGKMGTIYVGGSSEIEKKSNKDLVEDAVKACESAFNYGYNLGGNLIIPITINAIIDEIEDLTQKNILKTIKQAFLEVYGKILLNKFVGNDETVNSIIQQSEEGGKCYDLIRDEFNSRVINPTFTDVEILRAAVSIVSLIMSSNQYISIAVSSDVK